MIEHWIKRARVMLFYGERFEDVVQVLIPEVGITSLAHLIVRAAEVDMRRKKDVKSVTLPLRRKERRRGRVWWSRRESRT